MAGKVLKPRKRSSFWKDVKKSKVLLLMLLPGLVVLIINNYMPMAGIIIAFKKLSFSLGILKSPWVGFKNFTYFLNSVYAYRVTRNTVLFNAVFIILGTVCNIALALMLSELRNKRGAKVYQTLILLPFFLSWVAASYLGMALMNPNGLFNVILQAFGQQPINFYAIPKYWLIILPLANIWKGIGYGSIVYLAAIAGMDQELFEAAYLDGAGKFKQIWHLTLPMLKPIIIILTILAVGNIFRGDFGLFFQLTQNAGALYPVTDVIDTYVFRMLMKNADYGISTAVGLYQAAVGFALVLAANLVVRKIDRGSALF